MGSNQNINPFNNIHLPPTFFTSSSTAINNTTADTAAPNTSAQNSSPNADSGAGTVSDNISECDRTESPSKPEKPPVVRKKRGLYKKTILRQQAEAEAAAQVAAQASAPKLSSSHVSSSQAGSSSVSKGKARTDGSSISSTIESPGVRTRKSGQDPSASPTALEMEQELAMLAEEAEEAEREKQRHEEEAADRILKRAQVVKHLRALKSKLASAQIEIGHDLHFQSVDLFSQLYDEVLEDIGRDNNEMLTLLQNARNEHDDYESDANEQSSLSNRHGHMPTRSSDKPRKRDLISNISGITNNPSYSGSAVYDLDDQALFAGDFPDGSDYPGGSNSDQFIGQSWDIGSGGDAARPTKSKTSKTSRRGHSSLGRASLLDSEDDDMESSSSSSSRKPQSVASKPISQTREELQLQQRLELEDLQRQHRKEQEDFQRRQLDQLRDLQMKQNDEIQKFESAKAKLYREQMEGLNEKRPRLSHWQYGRNTKMAGSRHRQKDLYSTESLAYEFENGFHASSPDSSPSHSRSGSPIPQRPARQPRGSQVSSDSIAPATDRILTSRNSSSSRQSGSSSRPIDINGSINPLPMSTMTMALTAMSEKKKQKKRILKKSAMNGDALNKDDDYHESSTESRMNDPSSWHRKQDFTDDYVEVKRSASVIDSATVDHSTPSSFHRQRQPTEFATNLHHLRTYKSQEDLASEPNTRQSNPDVSHASTMKPKGKKRKNVLPTSTSSKDSHQTSTGSAMDGAMGFDKTLLSHFGRWNPDKTAENFFDFVLSDPPEIDVNESEMKNLLESSSHLGDSGINPRLNATLTSNAFKSYQGQQRLAQELASQSKVPPLRISGDIVSTMSGTADMEIPADLAALAHGDNQLILGEDPLTTFIQSQRQDICDQTHTTNGTNGASDLNGPQANHISSSSPFPASSPGMNMLFSEDGAGDWNFGAFMDPTNQYLSQGQHQ
ncbi:hypothetical protein BG011_007086 [Mortierella polycephala]|uniref:Uncharacterized protein n=1 Tax=Mortierella polycephala TaxID=41804 RepID=A0A9P6PR46_9FUNG|nr:hypothetical protein BG011_007086 [Mortierella polycephala]